jgi:hypothetical protein
VLLSLFAGATRPRASMLEERPDPEIGNEAVSG